MTHKKQMTDYLSTFPFNHTDEVGPIFRVCNLFNESGTAIYLISLVSMSACKEG